MGTRPIRDFRSDTVTVAGPAMREAMAAAPVGDDVYDEDPTVNRLQDRVAELAGKEAALFLTSGTQSNLSAVLSHCGRGDEFIIGRDYHILLNEAAGAAALGGASPWPIDCDADGAISPDDVRAAIREPDIHHPVSRLLCLENTVNGFVQPVDRIAKLAATGHDCGLAVHLDGARLFNAAVACGVGIDAFLDDVDTVSLCLSKGLGAPVGTVLAGDRATIARAHRARKILGGGLRQAGPGRPPRGERPAGDLLEADHALRDPPRHRRRRRRRTGRRVRPLLRRSLTGAPEPQARKGCNRP